MRLAPHTKTIIKVLLLIAILTFLFVYLIPTENPPDGNSVEISFLILIATAALAAIALIEFERANQLNTNELLTFISNRWNSKEIIKARQIIHEIFVYKYRFDQTFNPNNDFNIAMINTSKDVYEASKKIGPEGKKFVYLLNLLDHFESVSYFYISEQITLQEVKNIYGNNLCFYYQVLQKYIERRQIYHPSDFNNFSKVYNELSNKPKK